MKKSKSIKMLISCISKISINTSIVIQTYIRVYADKIRAGRIIGYNSGIIKNSLVDVYATTYGVGFSNIGGLIGQDQKNEIDNCIVKCNLNSSNSGTAKGLVSNSNSTVISKSSSYGYIKGCSSAKRRIRWYNDNVDDVILTAVDTEAALDETTAETVTNYGGGLSTPTSATLQEDGKTVLLLSSTTLNANQSYTLTVANVKDSAGNVITSTSKAFTPVDKEIPQIASVTAKGNSKVVAVFSEPVQNVGNAADNFKIDGYNLSILTGTPVLGADFKTVTITTDSPLLAGNHVLTLRQVDDTDVTDYAGYAATVSAHEFEVVNDVVIPEVSSVETPSQNEVNITFSEVVDIPALANVFWNTSGSESDNSKSVDSIEDKGNKMWTASFTQKSPIVKYLTAGQTVYFFVKDVEDLSRNKIAENHATNIDRFQVTVPTNEVPTVASVTPVSDKQIDVLFTSMVDRGTVTSSNFVVKNSDGSTVFSATDKIIIGYFDSPTLKTVADLAGNLYSPGETAAFGVAKGDMDISSTTGAKLDITSTSTLEFTLPTDQSTLSSVLATNFEITIDNGTNWFTPASALLSTDGKAVTFTVPDTNLFTSSNGGTNVDVRTVADPAGTKDVFDSKITGSKTTTLTTKNGIAATLSTFAVKDSSTIYLQKDGKLAASQNDELQVSIQVIQGGVIKAIGSIGINTAGADQSATGITVDTENTSSSYTLSGINIDLILPTITSNIPEGKSFLLNETSYFEYDFLDNFSDIYSKNSTIEN